MQYRHGCGNVLGMGFWTNKKSVAVELVSTPIREAFVYNGLVLQEWHGSRLKELLSHDDLYFQGQFNSYRDLIFSFFPKRAVNYTAVEKEKKEEAVRYFSYLSKQFIQFDRRYLSEREIGKLYLLVYVTLPELAQSVKTNVIKQREERGFILFVQQLESVLVSLRLNLRTLEDEYPEHMKFSTAQKLKEAFNNPMAEAPTQLKLPILKTSKPEIEKAYSEVSLLWLHAMSLSNSVEHEFFLERTATNYLPDVLKVYAPFQKATGSEQKNADTMLLEYLATLERKLYEILGSVMQNSLSNLKVEVDFMNAKVGPDEATSLLSLKQIAS